MITDSLLGTRIADYRLEALLGRGGMARVYRAFDTRLNRHVAIKLIDTPLRASEDYQARFEREAKAIARLVHPHIVTLYRYGEARGLLYMAMQYVEGPDLGAVLETYDSESVIESEKAADIVRAIGKALDYAHAQGVIHRDVKPGNILLDMEGKAYLTDFGLVLLSEIGTQGEIFGSPYYIAPEQAISSDGTVPQSDLYSIGVIAYEMFTGQRPFDSENIMDIAMMHMSDDPPPPREIRPDIPPELEAVLLRALAKKPGDRYPSGAAFAEAVRRALQGETVEVSSVPVAQEAPSKPSSMLMVPAADEHKAGGWRDRIYAWVMIILIIVAAVLFFALITRQPDFVEAGASTPDIEGMVEATLTAIVRTATPAP
jgi:serine/threonine-protein kinase